MPTHAELASRISTHREAVSREMAWLESKGLVLCDSESRKPVDFPDIEPRIVALVQQAVKLSRESALPKRDNRVDGIGYWLCADRVVSGY
mgnify:CR=1 FL=1